MNGTLSIKRRLCRFMFCGIAITSAFAVFSISSAIAAEEEPGDKVKIINVSMGQSHVITLPWPVKRIAVTDPKIAKVQVLTPKQVLVQGLAMGTTDLIIWKDDSTYRRVHVDVGVDLTILQAQLSALLPRSTIRLTQSQGVVIVEGKLRNGQQAQGLRKFLEARGIKKIDMSAVAGVHQVQLHVRVAEVSRTAIRKLGINIFGNWSDFKGASLIGSDNGGAINPLANTGGVGANVAIAPGVTLFGAIPKWNMLFFLEALAENQYLRILAEPKLVALSGEKASFLAGGEFPIPVVQGTSVGVGSSISIEYREYGVSLEFQPTVLGDGTIRLFVAPEVSELSDIGAVIIQGYRIPAIVTRRVATTLQLKSGQTFAMAGLMRRLSLGRASKLPWLGEMPVMGALARSTRHQSGETELMILVTATLVEPMDKTPPYPGILDVDPDDWELYALGQVEGTRKPVPSTSSEDRKWLKRMGLQNLRGPGAWARAGQNAPPSKAMIVPVNEQMNLK